MNPPVPDDFVTVIPRPVSVRTGSGHIELDDRTRLWSNAPAVAALLRGWVGPSTGWQLPDAEGPQDAGIVLRLDPLAPAGEGYRLQVGADGVVVESATEDGLRWGVQSLRQLFPPEIYSARRVDGVGWTLPAVTIEDAPGLGWRGVLLDVARWYQPIGFLYRAVELAAAQRLNVVHLHLTDDQGWRFEVRRYPRLTEVGAWRRESPVGDRHSGPGDGRRHGGFYTQDELRALVRFAAERGVTIVPEIDLPGHSQAAIAAYPELGNDPDARLEVGTGWGVIPHVLNLEDATVQFFCDVFDELADVFPGTYVHIGGDECPTGEWEASARADSLMRTRGITDPGKYETWFVTRIVEHLQSRGRRAIGWDEVYEAGLPADTAVMCWRDVRYGIAAASAGHDVVMTPNSSTYFDYYQSADRSTEPPAADHVLTLADAYRFDPVPDALSAEARAHVIGAQCALWSERIPTVEQADYMLFPRLCAFAEVAWGTANGDDEAFTRRLNRHLTRLDALGVGYRPLGPTLLTLPTREDPR